jgi:hypothetical protein
MAEFTLPKLQRTEFKGYDEEAQNDEENFVISSDGTEMPFSIIVHYV